MREENLFFLEGFVDFFIWWHYCFVVHARFRWCVHMCVCVCVCVCVFFKIYISWKNKATNSSFKLCRKQLTMVCSMYHTWSGMDLSTFTIFFTPGSILKYRVLPLWPHLCRWKEHTTFAKAYGIKVGVLWRTCLGTHWELEWNIVGTHWEPGKNEKKIPFFFFFGLGY